VNKKNKEVKILKKKMLEKIIVGSFFTNCYFIGSDATRNVFVIDPGAESKKIIATIECLKAIPVGSILTHGHPDHAGALKKIKKKFGVPLLYNEKEYKSTIRFKADQWLIEGDIIEIDSIKLRVLETGGHSPGGISLYTRDIRVFKEKSYDGVIFTGDLLFRRSIGRTDAEGCDGELLCSNIRDKIMYNPDLTDNFLILSGHMGITTIGEERAFNPYREHFL